MAKAIALFSGGLDSTLAILALLKQGVDVTAITFLNNFGCNIGDKSSCSKDPFSASIKFGFQVKLAHLSGSFIEIVKNPKFGHGRNMNPCIDCRILMLKEAKEMMRMTGADFLITGEVLGQRPMSQRRDTFPLIDREADVAGYVLRPLSAKHMKPTIPEEKGIVNRELLYDFSGRSRKPQMALAKEFGLTDYAAPAGGCLLTDPIYAYRLKELLKHCNNPDYTDINLLRLGRHFRLADRCKVIVGRDSEENQEMLSIAGAEDWKMKVIAYGSPITVIRGNFDNEALSLAASLCARYSDGKHLPEIDVTVFRNDEHFILKAKPADNKTIEFYRIEKKTADTCHVSELLKN
ncbi:MAG: 7-cyano-7-deazaguanine synthase [Nitrospirae bacterium]|nr:7-cyano-7-deazaguanine synthase [Nitrospirota bacterium]